MKFRKLYILPFLALGLGACSNEDDNLFDQSAAERLEAGQKEYFSTLCADGGTWVMEYFANSEEPGYLFVMKFHNDKSVEIATDHKWIDSQFHSERSLWDVINDNGNVLTFNSYNTLFHIFSTPENVVGPDAPLDTNGEDVDEQGYGHNGDYEFLLMENVDGNIRLLGKKRGIYSYLRRLPADTDAEAYLAAVAAKRAVFENKNFPTFVMTETATGAEYDVTGLGSGVVSIMPSNSTNPYAQTETKACILTPSGMRPLNAFDCIRINDSHFTVNEFTWAADGSLTAPGVRITAPSPAISLTRKDLTWQVDNASMSEALKSAFNDANRQLASSQLGSKASITETTIGYNADYGDGKIHFALQIVVSGEYPCNYYGELQRIDGTNKFKFELKTLDFSAQTIIDKASKVKDFMELFAGEYEAHNTSTMDPSHVQMQNTSKSDISFTINTL